jgi:hypothetical protein
MSEDSPTPSGRIITIDDVVYLHKKIVVWEEILEDRPWDEEKRKQSHDARETLENSYLIPVMERFTTEVEDMNKKLSDWTRVMDAVVYLKKEGYLKEEVMDARRDLKGPVKKLAVTVLALREKFYI